MTNVTLPTILESKNDHNLRTVPDENTLEASSDCDDNSSPQLQPSPSSGMKDDNETKGARSPIPVLMEHQKSQSPGSTVIKSPLQSDFYSAAKIEGKKPKTSSPTPIEPKVSPPRSRSPSPVVTGSYYENNFYLSTLKEVEMPRTPSPVITQIQKSRSPSPIAIKPQNGSKYQASPLKESSNAVSVVDSTRVTSRYHSDEESSRSPSPAEINTKKRPDPIGGIVTVPSQRYDEEKAKTVLREGEEATLESGDSTDYSLDSACGDSLLPTMDENSYLRSQVHPRFVLIEPSKGSTVGGYEVCLYGVHLDEAVMLHAQVFIDVYNVPIENWRVVPGQWPSLAPDATHCLLIRVPPMPPGEAWIEVETLNDGRLQCPRPFVFTDNFLMKHSMRGMGGQVNAASPPTIHKPASSFADFEFSPKEKVSKLLAKNNKDIDSARLEISKLYNEIMHLKVELQAKSADEVRVARELCILQNRLLEDGHLKYLERD